MRKGEAHVVGRDWEGESGVEGRKEAAVVAMLSFTARVKRKGWVGVGSGGSGA